MKKIGTIFKETSERYIKETLRDSTAVFIVKYSGLSSPDLSSLRSNLFNSKANLLVVKNTVARKALRDSGLDALVKNIEGPCGIVFVKDEPVAPSKVLFDFIKKHEQLKIEGGYLKDRYLERKDIESLSKLPSKEVLRVELLAVLNSPLSRLVAVLKHNLNTLVFCLEEREKEIRSRK
ncbi:MAG: 50S ribosomal protein L10 [Candidatus Omnitrophica bacterium]|nr:50S ribosomal protein L10 [Candidatus Omnitrophota bacterium]